MADARSTIIAMDAIAGASQEGKAELKVHSVNHVIADQNTIAQILQDEKTMGLGLGASKYRLQMQARQEAQSRLENYFQPMRFSSSDTCYTPGEDLFVGYTAKQIFNSKTSFVYRPGTDASMGIMLHHLPATGRDFYELAMSLSGDARGYYGENYWLDVPQLESLEAAARAKETVIASYQKKRQDLAADYQESLKNWNEDCAAKMASAKLRHERAMLTANTKTAITFKNNYDIELRNASTFLWQRTAELSEANAHSMALLKDEEALELQKLSTQPASSGEPLSYEQRIDNFQYDLLCDAENMGFKFLFSYKNGSTEEVALYAAIQLKTPNDFYDLAMLIKAGKDRFHGAYFDVYYRGAPAAPDVLKRFMYNLLSDAAKAGHLLAKHELIEATIEGEVDALNHVTLRQYSIQGVSIMLPRTFTTADDMYKLGSDLRRAHHNKKCIVDMPLVGPYYVLKNGKEAEELGIYLIKHSVALSKREASDSAKRAYADQASRVTQNTSSMFAASFARERHAEYARAPAAYMSTIDKLAKLPDSSVISTGSPIQSDSDASPVTQPLLTSPGPGNGIAKSNSKTFGDVPLDDNQPSYGWGSVR